MPIRLVNPSDGSESQSADEELEEIQCDDLKIQNTILTSYYLFRESRIKLVKDVIEEKSTHWKSLKKKAFGNMLDSDSNCELTLDDDECPNIEKLQNIQSENAEHTDFLSESIIPGNYSRKFQYFYKNNEAYKLKEPRPLAEFHSPVSPPIWPSDINLALDAPTLKTDTVYIEECYAQRKSKTKNELKANFGRKMEPKTVYVAKTKKSKKKQDLSAQEDLEATNILKFESRFESGNLQEAVQTSEFSYELKLRKDLNTAGHTQWFYFRVENGIKGIPYRFKITNLMKPKCLYNEGMKPLLYSSILADSIGKGWHRVGEDISYVENEIQEDGVVTFTLTFTFSFPASNDTIFFAHCYPYTYSFLQNFLHKIKCNPDTSQYIKHKVLGKTIAGNNLDMLCITKKVYHPDELVGRKALILIARVHPGETNSSWMMHGLIEFLLGTSMEAEYLRANYVIKLIPMLNPDGVIVGNHRCNLNGFDLNRQWRDSPKQQINSPEVWMARQMILNTLKSREIALFCDMHGHNRKHGVFLYGCNNDFDPSKRYMERVFPYMLSKQYPEVFSFKRCQFQLQKKKEGTARIVMFKEFGILNSFTLEASFCGSIDNDKDNFHFNPNHLTVMGVSIVKTLYEFFSQIITIENAIVPLKELQEISRAIESKKPEYLPLPSDSEDTTSDDEELRKRLVKKKKVKVATKTVPRRPILGRPSSSARLRKQSDTSLSIQNIESRPETPISNRVEPRQSLDISKPPKLPIQNLSIPDNVSVGSRPTSAASSNRNSVKILNNRQNSISSINSRKYFAPRHSSMPSIVIPVVTMVDFSSAARAPVSAQTPINCSFPVGVTPDGNKTIRYKPGVRSKSHNDIHYH
ncbi:Cytosolic carboxypeptidase 3 [Boothiomyces sp. JEL0866]|nr:Cytosolic carboxypeptidase 3 [Boothiomyces sp. JEL0866]